MFSVQKNCILTFKGNTVSGIYQNNNVYVPLDWLSKTLNLTLNENSKNGNIVIHQKTNLSPIWI